MLCRRIPMDNRICLYCLNRTCHRDWFCDCRFNLIILISDDYPYCCLPILYRTIHINLVTSGRRWLPLFNWDVQGCGFIPMSWVNRARGWDDVFSLNNYLRWVERFLLEKGRVSHLPNAPNDISHHLKLFLVGDLDEMIQYYLSRGEFPPIMKTCLLPNLLCFFGQLMKR